MTRSMVNIVNLLYLLKREPQTFSQLFDSGYFYSESYLSRAITTCRKAGLINYESVGRVKNPVDVVLSHSLHGRRWNKVFYLYYITYMGQALLSFYPNHQLRKVRGVNRLQEKKRMS